MEIATELPFYPLAGRYFSGMKTRTPSEMRLGLRGDEGRSGTLGAGCEAPSMPIQHDFVLSSNTYHD
jgi:hypothetical protein